MPRRVQDEPDYKAHGSAALRRSQVKAIRKARRMRVSCADLAKQYGVSARTISKAALGRPPYDFDRMGVLEPKRRTAVRGCSIPGCKGKHMAKGLCAKHYQRAWQEAKAPAVHVAPEGPVSSPWPTSKAWPDARDRNIRWNYPRILNRLGIKPYVYQRLFVNPPKPWRIEELNFVMLEGAKRIGKSFILGTLPLALASLPRSRTRLYAPEHTNAQREFEHIDNFLFSGERPLVKWYPEFKENLVAYNDDPRDGPLVMKWAWGAEISSMSWERKKQWVGEPIDLGIICEPGEFESGRIYTSRIKPNLQDRRGVCYVAGTPTDWMFDYHEKGHDHAEDPTTYCVCEIPRWANESLGITQRDILLARREETARDYAINWKGLWEYHEDVAYPKWDPKRHVKVISREKWERLKSIPAGWDHFLGLDTSGSFNACGQYVVSPQGVVLRIDEYTSYAYRVGNIEVTDERGFRPWMADVLLDIARYRTREQSVRSVAYVDPSSQMKPDLEQLGIPWVDANNAHEFGASNFNTYLARDRFMVVRPEGRPRYILEYELPRVKWQQTERGIGGHHRLRRGNDHCADEARYAISLRPLADAFEPERQKSEVEMDEEYLLQRSPEEQDSPLSTGGLM